MAQKLRVIPGGSTVEATDVELLRAFVEGERSAFSTLVRRHQETVFKVLRRYAPNPEDARDLTQRAFLQALEAGRRSLDRLEGAEVELPFRAWLLRIAINLGKNHLRDGSRWARAGLEVLDGQPSQAPQAPELLERAQAEALTRKAVLELPRRQREVFTLRIDLALPFAEVATTLGITEGNAKAHFHHAVKRLRDEVARLSQPGGTP